MLESIFQKIKNFILGSMEWLHLVAGFLISFNVGLYEISLGVFLGAALAIAEECYFDFKEKSPHWLWTTFAFIGIVAGAICSTLVHTID